MFILSYYFGGFYWPARVAIIAAVILVLVLSVIFYFITVDAAHMAGVTSYGG
jgi:hypothetical protein